MFECALSNFGHAAKSELKRQRKEKTRGRNLGLLLERAHLSNHTLPTALHWTLT
jgi:hypothetical protein